MCGRVHSEVGAVLNAYMALLIQITDNHAQYTLFQGERRDGATKAILLCSQSNKHQTSRIILALVRSIFLLFVFKYKLHGIIDLSSQNDLYFLGESFNSDRMHSLFGLYLYAMEANDDHSYAISTQQIVPPHWIVFLRRRNGCEQKHMTVGAF